MASAGRGGTTPPGADSPVKGQVDPVTGWVDVVVPPWVSRTPTATPTTATPTPASTSHQVRRRPPAPRCASRGERMAGLAAAPLPPFGGADPWLIGADATVPGRAPDTVWQATREEGPIPQRAVDDPRNDNECRCAGGLTAQTSRIVPSCRYRTCHDNASSSRCGVCLPDPLAVARSR